MSTLIFGGTFNPVHLGHMILAEEACLELGCSNVLFIPALRPPHKEPEGDPGPGNRLALLDAACSELVPGEPGYAVSDCELERPGPSYTIDTIRELKRSGAIRGRAFLLVGDDLLEGFPGWKEPQAILDEAELVVAHRANAGRVAFPWPHRYLDNLLIPISSSMVRARIAAGGAWRRLVPHSVGELIVRRGLYGFR